jgi:hypothetical protein
VDTGIDAGLPAADAAAPPAVDAARPPPPVDAGPGGSGGCYTGAYELDAGPDANPATDTCAYVYGCGLAGTGLGVSGCQVLQIVTGGALAPIPQMTCWLPQDAGCDDDAFAPEDGGGVTVYCTPCPAGGGRRPAGLVSSLGRTRRAHGVGSYLASLAFEEQASIVAFERLRAELEAMGAPPELVAAAGRAAADEVRHARAMTRAAATRGGAVPKLRVRPVRPRSPAAIAAENAAEGCVRETYGALVLRWQAAHAGDARLAKAFERIAADESRHAALSWAVAAWIEPRLDAGDRRRVARARQRALRRLEAAAPPDESLALVLGLPRAAEARCLIDALARELGLREPGVDDLGRAQGHRHDRHLRVHAERRGHRAPVRDV